MLIVSCCNTITRLWNCSKITAFQVADSDIILVLSLLLRTNPAIAFPETLHFYYSSQSGKVYAIIIIYNA